MDEDGEGVAELVAVEGTLRLSDHVGVEAAVRSRRAVRSSLLRGGLPGPGTAVADVEVLGDRPAAGGLDQCSGASEMPVSGGLRVLQVLGGAASGEGEVDHVRSGARVCGVECIVGVI